MLGVKSSTLEQFGAVSEQTVKEMAEGALNNSHANTAIAISGVAGPSGGSPEKPVGTVCIAWAGSALKTKVVTQHFQGDRNTVRADSVRFSLMHLLQILNQTKY